MRSEQDLAVMMLAVDRILADVLQRVVHPAHVPFVAEAESAEFDRARHLRPGRGFLRRAGRLREVAEQFSVETAQEFDGLEIFTAAVLVGNPASRRPAVVKIQHGGNRIDAKPVDTIAVQPEQRVRQQKIGDFGAAEIVDQRAPVEVPALQRIGVFVERGAVELAEAVRIVGKVARHPVQDHAEAGAVAGIDQGEKILRRAEPAGRGVHAGRLIAPGAIERMFADRQEFQMGEAHVFRIGRQRLGEVAIVQPFVAGLAAP